jgi:hypothetical protein
VDTEGYVGKSIKSLKGLKNYLQFNPIWVIIPNRGIFGIKFNIGGGLNAGF